MTPILVVVVMTTKITVLNRVLTEQGGRESWSCSKWMTFTIVLDHFSSDGTYITETERKNTMVIIMLIIITW